MKKFRIVKCSRISTYPDGRKEETDVYYSVEKRSASGIVSFLFDPIWLPIKAFYSFDEAKEYVDAEVLKSAVKTKDVEKIVYEK